MGGLLILALISAVITSVTAPWLLASRSRQVRADVARHEARVASYVRAALVPSCAHPDAVPVDLLLTGERVAWWCEACKTQLEAGFDPKPAVAITGWAGGGGGGSAAFTGAGITITAVGGSANAIHYNGGGVIRNPDADPDF
jgi:hypothetical protein